MRHTLIAAAFILVLTLLMSCSKSATDTYRHFDGSVWSTTFHITYNSDKNLDDSIMATLRKVEMSLSPFEDSSVVSAINDNRSMATDAMLRTVFIKAKEINRASEGRYDPTVGPAVELWGFGKHKDLPAPTQAQIDSVLTMIGIDSCRLDGEMMVKKNAGTQFNFSSITKGYGCDMVGEMLRRNGCTDFMVEIGGEMALSGMNPRGTKWHVMVESPSVTDTIAGKDRVATISVSDCGVATSGNYRNYREIGKRRLGHTLNPANGKPVLTSTLSATVIASDAMTADALATACMAMNVSSALAMVEKIKGAEAMIVTSDSESSDGLHVHVTSGFPK